MGEFSNYIKILEEFIDFFDNLIPIEQEKLDAAIKNRVSFVEECMHKEQAAVLRLRGLEQKREKEQEHLGMKDYTFRQILEKVPEDIHSALKPLFDRLSEQVTQFQSISESAKDMIEVNLHVIQSSLAEKAPGRETYSASGKKSDNDKPNHFTSRSV
ncbi:MAG: flagellar protein FlgN [Dorea sp.]|nr:flagellar protein FlgN [Dorea sp.]